MSTDSGNEDSGESSQQSEKTPNGKVFLGILIFLTAVGGVVLITMSGQEPSLPQIEGVDGNPIVGRINAVSGALGFIETLMYLIAGGILLVIALVVYIILRKSPRPWLTIAGLGAFVFVVIAFKVATETIQDNKQDSERIRAANILRGHDFDKWRRPHAPGPFVDYYDSGEKAVEGQYDVNKKMSGLWTQWRETGELAEETMWVDGLLNGTHKSWPPGHVRPDESEYRSGQPLHVFKYYAGGKIMYESKDTYGEDGKRHSSTTQWYESGQARNQSTHIDGLLQGATGWHENGQKKSETFPHESNQYMLKRSWSASGVAVPCAGRRWLSNGVLCID
jgi:antitoxin component YwqK of YwqJK toxin-antitoxin module